MRLKVWAGAFCFFAFASSSLHAQGLGEVAKAEAERRGKVQEAGKVYTNSSLSAARPAPAAPEEVISPKPAIVKPVRVIRQVVFVRVPTPRVKPPSTTSAGPYGEFPKTAPRRLDGTLLDSTPLQVYGPKVVVVVVPTGRR